MMSAIFLWVIATATPLDSSTLNAEKVLMRVRSAYSVETYHDQAVTRSSFNDFKETSLTLFTRTYGLKHIDKTAANPATGMDARTIVYFGPPTCVRTHWIEKDNITTCSDLCAVSAHVLP